MSLVSQLSSSAEKAKNVLISALNDISYKYTSLAITDEQKPVLQRIITEYETALVRAHQRVAVFYDVIMGRLSETGCDITPLLDLPDVSVTFPPPAQPLLPHDLNVKGKFTQMTLHRKYLIGALTPLYYVSGL